MNHVKRLIPVLIAVSLLAMAPGAHADDTDVYVNNTPGAGSEPLVMFSLDYRPNLGSTACQGTSCDYLKAGGYLKPIGPYTFFDVLRAVLKKVMQPLTGVQVGLMVNHDNINNCAGPANVKSKCSNGGYMARGFKSFVAGDTNLSKAQFNAILAALPTPQGTLSHAYQGKELFFEFYRYLSGQDVYNGHVGYTDFASNINTNLNVDGPAYSWDPLIENLAKTKYLTPINAGASCTKIFTVNIMFQVSNQEDDSNTAIKASLAAGGMNFDPKSFDNVIQWLNNVDVADGLHGTAPNLPGKQNVTSFFIVDPTKINTSTTAYAQAGGTGVPLPLDTDPKKLEATLTDIFKQIISVSTTFVAASVPVNVLNRAEIVDNVYIALFQPDAVPYWKGNIKKLRISGLSSSNPMLVDVNGDPAIAADGRIRYPAVTYWTQPAALPAPDLTANEVAGADGRSVNRGGSGQNIPGFLTSGPGAANAVGSRTLYYDNGASLSALNANAATASALQATLGAADSATALALLKYARGQDVDDLNANGNVTEARSWIMADPLHSRPLPLNYGARSGYTAGNPAIYIGVATNDGIFHFLRNTTTSGAQSGQEAWGFMPKASMGKLATLRANATGVTHPYLLDSSPVAYMDDTNGDGTIGTGEKAYVYFGMGRGGTGYYALDVSDPENPSLLWTIAKSGSFTQLGLTLPEPRVIKVDSGSGAKPALVFGGGYDVNKDVRAGVGTNDTSGNAIYVVDAATGALIWRALGGAGSNTSNTYYQAGLLDSIPSTVSILDSDGDGLHDRVYVGDTGGNVWRADMAGTNTANWKLTILAKTGRHSSVSPTKAMDRRFHHRPDVVQGKDSNGAYDAVIIGSGDRSDPLDKGGLVNNFVYMIKDRNVIKGSGTATTWTHATFGDVTNTCVNSLGLCAADLTDGWKLGLVASGEKSLATPTTIGGTVYFTTYIPQSGSAFGTCSPSEGTGRLYAVSLKDAKAVRDYDLTTIGEERYTTLKSQGIPAEVVALPPNSILRPDLNIERTGARTRFPTYWFETEDGDL